jgi:hypothetical protein
MPPKHGYYKEPAMKKLTLSLLGVGLSLWACDFGGSESDTATIENELMRKMAVTSGGSGGGGGDIKEDGESGGIGDFAGLESFCTFDLTEDGVINLADVSLVSRQFHLGTCHAVYESGQDRCIDSHDDGIINLSDVSAFSAARIYDAFSAEQRVELCNFYGHYDPTGDLECINGDCGTPDESGGGCGCGGGSILL